MKGTLPTFIPRVPTDDEMANYQHLEIISDHPWEPGTCVDDISTNLRDSTNLSFHEVDAVLSQLSSIYSMSELMDKIIKQYHVFVVYKQVVIGDPEWVEMRF